MTTTTHPHCRDAGNAWWLHNLSAGFDPWANTIEHAFAIAEVLYSAGEHIPGSWQFRPSPMAPIALDDYCPDPRCDGTCGLDGHEWPDCEYATMLRAGDVTADELRYVGSVLMRYASVLDRAGLSY